MLPATAAENSVRYVDLAMRRDLQVVVDRISGQYLGHPTTVLLEDGRTILCVYPEGHGRGRIILRRSRDGGKTWSSRLPTPDNWSTSLETPTIHRVIGPDGTKRLILWSGLYPARLSISTDDGDTWTPLAQAGSWGGIVVMGSVMPVQQRGTYLSFFHDDGRFYGSKSAQTKPVTFTLYSTKSTDGGLTWNSPTAIWSGDQMHLCEPGALRLRPGNQLALLLRENSRKHPSQLIFSSDEGATWSSPQPLHKNLMGDRHTIKRLSDGRLFVTFRDMNKESATYGDWVAWVGTDQDIRKGRPGQLRIRLMDNQDGTDCAYPGLELLPDGTIVTTTYGHWIAGQPPYIVCVRFKLSDIEGKTSEPPMP